jgi:amino acid permease
MGYKLKWPFSRKDKEKKRGPKTVSIFLGFFFMVNYCLGTGFLGVPFSFFYAGYLASIPTLLLIAFISWNNAEWTIETMSRAQAIDTWRREKKRESGVLQSESESEREILIQDTSEPSQGNAGKAQSSPRYEIRCTRKFEPIEVCEIFLNQWGKYAYMIIWSLNCFLTGWSFTTVAASAWSTNIPFSSSTIQQCAGEDFLRVLIPQNQPCWHAYMICVLLFAVIVVPLSLLNLSEQALLHMTLGLLRFVTIAIIIFYCVVKLSIGTNECDFTVTHNASLFLNENSTDADFFTSDNTSLFSAIEYGFSDLSRVVFRFDVKGWLVSIPIFTFALMIHQGIPALTHPIKEKHFLRQFMVAMFGIATISYLSLGVVVPLWFKANIQETCTLNWVSHFLPIALTGAH